MAESNRDRINPSLLDRLTDEAPGNASARGGQSVTLSELRRSVLRDLNWLFNTSRLLTAAEIESWPQVRNSVLNYGLPALSGLNQSTFRDAVRQERSWELAFESKRLFDLKRWGLYTQVIFPRLCDFLLNQPFVTKQRRELLARAHGEVLEIGFGTGLNLPCYPAAVRKLTAIAHASADSPQFSCMASATPRL